MQVDFFALMQFTRAEGDKGRQPTASLELVRQAAPRVGPGQTPSAGGDGTKPCRRPLNS